MDYTFVVWFCVFFVNLIFIFKPIPLFAIPLAVMSIFFAGSVFYFDANFSGTVLGFFMIMFLLMFAVIQLYSNVSFLRRRK